MAGAKLLWGAVLGLVLSGCSLVPGSNIRLGQDALPHDAQVDFTNKLDVKAITPELLARLRQPSPIPDSNPDLNKAIQGYDYIVGPGDVLAVTVWDHPELTNPAAPRLTVSTTGTAPSSGGGLGAAGAGGVAPTGSSAYAGSWVDADGTMYYPYIGIVRVAGLKIRDIRTLLHDRLSRYMPDPQLDVTVVAFRAQRVYVTGEVNRPGPVPLTNVPVTLLDAVNQAGGLVGDADWKDVTLTRSGHEFHYSLRDLYKRGDIRQNTLLENNDVVFVPRTDFNEVFVLGEVGKKQSLPMSPYGLTLADALAQSGGINELTANASGIFVLRRDTTLGSGKLIDVYQLNAQSALALVLADQFPLQERDIVYITAAPIDRWNKVINLLLPTLDFLYLDVQTQHTVITNP